MVEFANRLDLEHWLDQYSRKVSLVIASRSALRRVPSLVRLETIDHKTAGTTILPTFRALTLPWASTLWPKRLKDLSIYAANAAGAANKVNAADAVGAAGAAADAASIIYIPTYAARAARVIYSIHDPNIHADTTEIVKGLPVSKLAQLPLSNQLPLFPDTKQLEWQKLKQILLALDEDWDVWTDWYEARLRGDTPNEPLEVARASISREIWEQGPKVVNAHIKALIEEHEPPVSKEPTVPDQKPAALEPVWHGGMLALPAGPATDDLEDASVEAAFTALKQTLDNLATETEQGVNIDERFTTLLRSMSGQIPRTVPSQPELFIIGHNLETLNAYAKKVNEQWPDFLVPQYHSLCLLYDRTLRQFPKWRAFRKNAEKADYTPESITDIADVTGTLAAELRTEDSRVFVEVNLPTELEKLSNPLKLETDGWREIVELGKDQLADDLLESINNIYKPIAETLLSPYLKNVKDSTKTEFIESGKRDGKALVKWTRRVLIGGGLTAAGKAVGTPLVQHLITNYPEKFQWLQNIIDFLSG